MTTTTCTLCHGEFEEVCADEVCRGCHKDLTFEDCVSGRWADEQRQAAGLPPMDGYIRDPQKTEST